MVRWAVVDRQRGVLRKQRTIDDGARIVFNGRIDIRQPGEAGQEAPTEVRRGAAERGHRIVGRILIAVVADAHLRAVLELLQIIQAHNVLRLRLGLCQGRQEQRGQDGDDGNDHQQFYQRKSLPSPLRTTSFRFQTIFRVHRTFSRSATR